MFGVHDVLAPAGPQAYTLSLLWWLMLGVCTAVFVAVMTALWWAMRRAPRADTKSPPNVEIASGVEHGARKWVGIGVAASTVLLVGLLVASFLTDRALARLPLADAIHIDLTAHQFWWEARYDDAEPSRVFTTANELHVPVGRPVLLTLRASDVIHSFWVPSLTGKKDLIPGRESTLAFRVDTGGVYRGQCAEFCGWQHANMAVLVIAEPPADYERWADMQRTPALDPPTQEARHGRDIFVSGTCAMCHTVAGTLAQGRRAPDLTHIASRQTLAAGTLPNTDAARAAWIVDPQQLKPGSNMPPTTLTAADLGALNAWLGSLR
jgi:cytochrome c oxidase subunit II